MTYIRPVYAPSSLILPAVTEDYDPRQERERDRVLIQADGQNLKRGRDVQLTNERLILVAPDGGRWQVKVGNTGTLSTTSVP